MEILLKAFAWFVLLTITLSLAAMAWNVFQGRREFRYHARVIEDFTRGVGAVTTLSDRVDRLEKKVGNPPPPTPGTPGFPAVIWFAAALAVAGALNAAAIYRGDDSVGTTPAADNLEVARRLMREKNYQLAVLEFSAARRHGSAPEECLPRLAECHIYLGEYQKAFEVLDVLNQTIPDCGIAYHLRGVAYERQGRLALAVPQYRAAAARGCRYAELRLRNVA